MTLLVVMFAAADAHALISLNLPSPVGDNLTPISRDLKRKMKVAYAAGTICGTGGGIVGMAAGLPAGTAGMYILGLIGNSITATPCTLAVIAVEAPVRSIGYAVSRSK